MMNNINNFQEFLNNLELSQVQLIDRKHVNLKMKL